MTNEISRMNVLLIFVESAGNALYDLKMQLLGVDPIFQTVLVFSQRFKNYMNIFTKWVKCHMLQTTNNK